MPERPETTIPLSDSLACSVHAWLRSLAVCMGIWVVQMSVIVTVLGLNTPYPGDELRFIQTSRQFGEQFSWNLLMHYEELSTPLPFMIYGLWGRLVDWELAAMRVAPLLIAAATFVVLHRLLWLAFGTFKQVLFVFLWIAANPYMWTMSLFVYTDMPAILFVLTAIIAVWHRRPFLFAFAVAAALLCRQYLVFLPAAAGAYFLLRLWHQQTRRDWAMLIACGVSGVPLALLALCWGGLNPDNQVQHIYLDEVFKFHISSLILYLSILAIYLLPILAWYYRTIYRNWRVVGACVLISIIYWVFPVQPSPSAIAGNYTTVGLFHRALEQVFAGGIGEDVVFWIGLAAALPVMWLFLVTGWRMVRTKQHTPLLFLILTIFTFMAVMPLSYLVWEKYFLPLLPVASIALVLVSDARWRQQQVYKQPDHKPKRCVVQS